jgi:hypothetical protein
MFNSQGWAAIPYRIVPFRRMPHARKERAFIGTRSSQASRGVVERNQPEADPRESARQRHGHRAHRLIVTEAHHRAAWAAHLFRLGADATVHAFGAVRASQRLHWTEDAARREAEGWAREMHLGSPSWEVVDKTAAVAWVNSYAFVARSMGLPLKEPPSPTGSSWAAFLFARQAGTIVHPAFGVLRGTQRLHWTPETARAEAEGWAREMRLGPLQWETIDDTGAIAWLNHVTPRAFRGAQHSIAARRTALLIVGHGAALSPLKRNRLGIERVLSLIADHNCVSTALTTACAEARRSSRRPPQLKWGSAPTIR